MSSDNCSRLRVRVPVLAFAVVAVTILAAAPVPAAAQDTQDSKMPTDNRMHDGGMRGGGSLQQGTPSANQKPSSKGASAGRQTEAKKGKRAAKDIPTNKCNGYGGCCRGVIL